MTKLSITFAAVTILAALTIPLDAQPRVFTTGLLNPAKLILGPSGSLLVSEFDAKPNSGRVSLVTSSGVRRTLIDGLPSGVGANGPDGPTGMVLDGNTLYLAIGEGDQLQNGDAQGTAIPNTKGPASPILATILQFDFSGPVDGISDRVYAEDGRSFRAGRRSFRRAGQRRGCQSYGQHAFGISISSRPGGNLSELASVRAGENSERQSSLPGGRGVERGGAGGLAKRTFAQIYRFPKSTESRNVWTFRGSGAQQRAAFPGSTARTLYSRGSPSPPVIPR